MEGSWKNCKYSIGNIEIDKLRTPRFIKRYYKKHPQIKLLEFLFNSNDQKTENSIDKLLEENNINKFYLCKNKKLVEIRSYPLNEAYPTKNGELSYLARLFVLDLNEEDFQADLLGDERWFLDNAISKGLRMCTHCKYFNPKN